MYCEINTVSLTYTLLEVLDCCNWCCQIIDSIQYIHAWSQGGIIISNYDISLLQFLFCKNTVNKEESFVIIIIIIIIIILFPVN